MSEVLDEIGVCCAHTLGAHPRGGKCVHCPCARWEYPGELHTRCPARMGVNADPEAGRCWLAAGHLRWIDHALEPEGSTVTRFTDESAHYPSLFRLSVEALEAQLRQRDADVTAGQRISRETLDKDPTLSAEVVREQLAAHGISVTAGSKVTRCPYWYEGRGLSRNVRCEEAAGHVNDHEADVGDGLTFRWTSDVAKWRDPQVDPEPVPSSVQVGGDHYVKRAIGPWDIWQEYGMNAFEGAVLKYLLRWRDKGGVEDLKKARHTLDRLIEIEEAKGDPEAG